MTGVKRLILSNDQQDMKSALSKQLNRRRDLAARRISITDPHEKKESVSKGRKEIVIEPSCSEVHVILIHNHGKTVR